MLRSGQKKTAVALLMGFKVPKFLFDLRTYLISLFRLACCPHLISLKLASLLPSQGTHPKEEELMTLMLSMPFQLIKPNKVVSKHAEQRVNMGGMTKNDEHCLRTLERITVYSYDERS